MYKFWGGEGARTGGPGTGDTYAHEILKRSTPYFILCAESGIFWRRGEIMRTIREELAPVYEGGSPKGKGGGCLHLLIQYSTDNHNTSTTRLFVLLLPFWIAGGGSTILFRGFWPKLLQNRAPLNPRGDSERAQIRTEPLDKTVMFSE